MASLLSILETAFTAAKYIYDAGKGMAENAHECRQFSQHADLVLKMVKGQAAQSASGKVVSRVTKLRDKLVDLQRTMQGLSKKGWLHRLLWHSDISSQIRRAYEEVDRTVQTLGLNGIIDILRMQRESEVARKRDVKIAQQNFDRLLQSNKDILEALQVRPPQIEEAKLAVRKHLPKVPGSKQRQVLERGLQDLERRSRNVKTLPDRFVITSLDVIIHEDLKLGSGGYSQVYMGSWHGTKVAVKVLEKGLSHSLMDKEIGVWKDLRHPNILAFYGACSLADPPFMVCEYKANGNVIEYLRQDPDAERCQLLYEASLGLVYLHQHRVVHGDIKGSNILVDHAGKACLADFGLSQIKLHSSTLRVGQSPTGQAQGTLRWMSPEQMLHGELSIKTDIYSFAMTIYEVFTGYPPFSGAPEHAVQRNVCGPDNIRPRRPEDSNIRRLGLDDTMWAIVTCCWDRNPAGRMTTKQLSGHLRQPTQLRGGAGKSSTQAAAAEPLSKQASRATIPKTSPYTVPETSDSKVPWLQPQFPVPPAVPATGIYDQLGWSAVPGGYCDPTYLTLPMPENTLPYPGGRVDLCFVPVNSLQPHDAVWEDTAWHNRQRVEKEPSELFNNSADNWMPLRHSTSTPGMSNHSSRTNVTQTVLKLAEEAESGFSQAASTIQYRSKLTKNNQSKFSSELRGRR